jgi:hypothetical protein
VVCCLLHHGQRPESIPTPQKFIDAIKPYLVDA